jgi:hypothetical protein
MGLDIYLYRYDDFENTRERENIYHEFSEKLWADAGEYDSLTEEQKNELRQKEKDFAQSLSLDEWGSDKFGMERIEESHPEYPDHYFKIGYFRSSYNSGGIERILRNLDLPTMSDIFRNDSDEYYRKPDWEQSLVKCEEVLELFKSKGAYRVNQVSGNIFRNDCEVKSESDALRVFLKEIEKSPEGGYSNINGEFYQGEPIKVLALIPGKTKIFKEMDCTYVITESDNSWYIQALEIVRDTIKYVLSKENKEQYYLHWSG